MRLLIYYYYCYYKLLMNNIKCTFSGTFNMSYTVLTDSISGHNTVFVSTDRTDVNILVCYGVSYICVFSAEHILSESCHGMMDQPLVQEVFDLI